MTVTMHAAGPNNPLHGVKLETIVTQLVEYYGWEELGERIRINSFNTDPSVKSSLKFLRKTPWAREKVEQLYLYILPRLRNPTSPSPAMAEEPVPNVDEASSNVVDDTPPNVHV